MAHSHARALASSVKATIFHLKTHYKRARLNGPRQSLLILLATIQSGVNRIGIKPAKLELLKRLDGAIGWTKGKVPSVSSMARALRKLKPVDLQGVIDASLEHVTKAFGSDLLIHGQRLVALDGVHVNAQRTSILARWLGLPKQADNRKAHQPQALVVVARCVRTGVVLAQEIVRHNGSERACARKLIARLATMGPMIIVMDRGFPSRDLIAALMEKKMNYIVRMCGGRATWRDLRGRMTGPANDAPVALRLRSADGRWGKVVQRAILTDKAGPGRPSCNRTPRRMVLLTNMVGKYWSTQRIIALYHRRWDIETSFREDKRLLGATRSHAKTKEGFANELLALQIYRIVMALIAALVVAEAGMPRWDDARARRITTTQLIVTAWWLVEVALICPGHCLEKIETMIHEIVRDADKKRPGRKFKRKCKGVEGVWKNKAERDRN